MLSRPEVQVITEIPSFDPVVSTIQRVLDKLPTYTCESGEGNLTYYPPLEDNRCLSATTIFFSPENLAVLQQDASDALSNLSIAARSSEYQKPPAIRVEWSIWRNNGGLHISWEWHNHRYGEVSTQREINLALANFSAFMAAFNQQH